MASIKVIKGYRTVTIQRRDLEKQRGDASKPDALPSVRRDEKPRHCHLRLDTNRLKLFHARQPIDRSEIGIRRSGRSKGFALPLFPERSSPGFVSLLGAQRPFEPPLFRDHLDNLIFPKVRAAPRTAPRGSSDQRASAHPGRVS